MLPLRHLVSSTTMTTSPSDVEYTIKLAPVSKKNSQRILTNRATGKPFVAPSKQYKDYEAKAVWYLRPRPPEPINCPVNVKMVFYMPTRRRVDIVNLQEACLDVLVSAGILADDNSNIVASMDGSRVEYDKDDPRTEIKIGQKAVMLNDGQETETRS